jgi:ribonuclease R
MKVSRSLENQILSEINRAGAEPVAARDLIIRLKLRNNEISRVTQILRTLEQQRKVRRLGNRFEAIKKTGVSPKQPQGEALSGRIRMNRQGSGMFHPAASGMLPIEIPADATGNSMHGDRVLVETDRVPRMVRGRQSRLTGRVVKILDRARSQVVGTLQKNRQGFFVLPDDPRAQQEIFVPPPHDVGRAARIGDKVVVEISESASSGANERDRRSSRGEVIELLGPPDAEGVDMLSVIRQYSLPLHFPRKVLDEAESFGRQIKPGELKDRKDCRAHQVVTIDPEDAKDFDDAICLVPEKNGQWRLWVHIADVSHYVKPGSALDIEAAERGNSTYLVDRVIPMLPEALSNELCSLKPDVERLTKCAEFVLDDSGQVLSTDFYPAVIRSQRRFSYKEAFAALKKTPSNPIEVMLHDANRMAQKLRRKRFDAGSLELDFPESKIILDSEGRVARLERVVNDISHQLIEEFMLLANEAVAAKLIGSGRQSIHRIHEPPDPKRLEEFREEVLSHHVPCGHLTNRREVQKLLSRLNEIPIGAALKIGFLRSLMRARYSPDPVGHYGLAKKKYTHFTSPIRRYADLVVHRSLFQKPGLPVAAKSLTELADHISETERSSDDAERDSRDVKLFAYLDSQLQSGMPQKYDALVTDVRNFGLFVDIPGLAMGGLVALSGLEEDYYLFDASRKQLEGRRSRKIYKLGDPLQVQIARVDRVKRQVDFRLAQKETLLARREPRPAGLRRKQFERRR